MSAPQSPNPYQSPEAVLEAVPGIHRAGPARTGRLWGLVFSMPCVAMFLYRIAQAGEGMLPAARLAAARWLLLMILAMAGGWAFERYRLMGSFLRLVAASFLFGALSVLLSAGFGLLWMAGQFHPGAHFPWERLVLSVAIALGMEGVLFSAYFFLLGLMIRWRLRIGCPPEAA